MPTDSSMQAVRQPRQWRRIASGAALILAMAAGGWLFAWNVFGLTLLGVFLVAAFQLLVLRVPLRRVWARDSVGLASTRLGKVAVIAVLSGVVLAAVAQTLGSWISNGWFVLLLVAALLVSYASSRRVLLALTVASTVVLATSVVIAPRLAADRAGDPELLAQLGNLASAGALDGFRDLAIAEVDLNAPQPVRNASIGSLDGSAAMEVGSITKAMTGLVIADAVDRGELSMDAPVATYLTSLAGSPIGGVTLGELVTHHAGLPDFGASVYPRAAWRALIGQDFLADDLAGILGEARQDPLSTRGRYVYSTLGAALAGQAAAAAARLTYPELMRTRLFVPLGMSHTEIPITASPVAGGYTASGLPASPWLMDGYAPGGAAVSTADDLALLATALLKGTAPGMDSLDPTRATDRTNTLIGAFWQTSHWFNGQTIIWHNGQTSGYTAYLGLDRRNHKAVVVLSDVGRDDITDLGVRLLSDTPERAASPSDLYAIGQETLHLQCAGTGSPTVMLLAGMGDNTTTWNELRTGLGPNVRTCAWDYPGTGWSTGATMMTAQRAADALDATLAAAGVPRPFVIVGHSIGGLTTRVFVGQHPDDVSGVVLFDPTVADFARMFDSETFRPGWDGTASANSADQVTAWPELPFRILRHDPAVYDTHDIWDSTTETRWAADQTAYSDLNAQGTVALVPGAGHYVYRDSPDLAVSTIRDVLSQTNHP